MPSTHEPSRVREPVFVVSTFLIANAAQVLRNLRGSFGEEWQFHFFLCALES